MDKQCESCGESYDGHPTARFCSARCKKRVQRGAETVLVAVPDPETGRIEATTTQKLSDADILDDPAAQVVLQLARRLDNPNRETGAGLAALAKQFQVSLTAALGAGRRQETPLERMRDELAAKRSARGA